MTPAERALLVAIGQVLNQTYNDRHLREMLYAVVAEDNGRPLADSMPAMSREAYNERLERGR
jgi:hypothetical protein